MADWRIREGGEVTGTFAEWRPHPWNVTDDPPMNLVFWDSTDRVLWDGTDAMQWD